MHFFLNIFIFILIIRFFIFNKIGLDISTFQENNYEYSNLFYLEQFFTFNRIIVVFKYLFLGLASNLLYILSLLIMLFIFFYEKNKIEIQYYFASLILNLMIIYSFYIFTSMPIEYHLKVSIERVLFEVLGIYIIPIVIFINAYSQKIFKSY